MNNLRKATITTLEVAEMMETEHWKLLRKLDGRTGKDGQHERGYIEILGDNHLVVCDYFIKSTYLTEQNKEMPCYEVTRMGCDFLANKSTGENGIVFTAKYVKRFYELEGQSYSSGQLDTAVLKGLSSLGNLIRNTMKDEKAKPYETAEVLDSLFRQSGLVLPKQFIQIPEYEQMRLDDFMK